MAQPLKLVDVQAYDVRLTVTVALGGQQHITEDRFAIENRCELVEPQRFFIQPALIHQQDHAGRQKHTLDTHDLIEITADDPTNSSVEAGSSSINADELRHRLSTGTQSNKILDYK